MQTLNEAFRNATAAKEELEKQRQIVILVLVKLCQYAGAGVKEVVPTTQSHHSGRDEKPYRRSGRIEKPPCVSSRVEKPYRRSSRLEKLEQERIQELERLEQERIQEFERFKGDRMQRLVVFITRINTLWNIACTMIKSIDELIIKQQHTITRLCTELEQLQSITN
jgi:hypothetical protein